MAISSTRQQVTSYYSLIDDSGSWTRLWWWIVETIQLKPSDHRISKASLDEPHLIQHSRNPLIQMPHEGSINGDITRYSFQSQQIPKHWWGKWSYLFFTLKGGTKEVCEGIELNAAGDSAVNRWCENKKHRAWQFMVCWDHSFQAH